jgi:hypothetical protein
VPIPAVLSTKDYAYAAENIPKIRVLGESAFWNTELENKLNEDDAALNAPAPKEGEEEADPVNTVDQIEQEQNDALSEDEEVRRSSRV